MAALCESIAQKSSDFVVQTECAAISHNVRMRNVSPVARELKAIRERAHLSVRELAGELGLPSSTYASYENKFRQPYLPVDLVKGLIRVLRSRGVSAEELLALAGVDDELLSIVDESVKPTDAQEIEGAQALVDTLKKTTGRALSKAEHAAALRDGLRYYRKHSARLRR